MKDCGKSYHGKHLRAALAYITVPEKTQQGRLVAGINCVPEFAFEQMKETKRKYGKLDKRQGYHLVLSFKENEVTPDTAMELTSRFVKEYLGSEYEAVYAVHDNTRHIHAHIVFNSVSFLTGKKYRYEKGDWAREIQPITNRLCQEYGLSTIEIEDDKLNQDVEYPGKPGKSRQFSMSGIRLSGGIWMLVLFCRPRMRSFSGSLQNGAMSVKKASIWLSVRRA